jgi:hypothetical protein
MAYKFSVNIDKLREDINAANSKKKYEADPRFWKPTQDSAGNGYAVVRFLPDPTGECWSKIYTHNFSWMDGSNKKYWIRNCINTFGFDQECPVCKKNGEFWNSAFEVDKALYGQRKRKLIFISNVLIVQDKAVPENEGKVFLYQYGVKIFDKLKRKIVPTEEDLADEDFKEFNPFHPIEGANFKIKIKKQGDYPNYDDSCFSDPKPLFVGDEKKINAAVEACYGLAEFLAPEKFPTNEETVRTLGPILGAQPVPEAEDKPAPEPKNEAAEEWPDTGPTEEQTAGAVGLPSVGSIDEDDEAFFETIK